MTEPTQRSRALARRLALSLPPVRRLVDERDALRRAKARTDRRLAGQDRQITELKAHVAELSAAAPTAAGGHGSRSVPLRYLFVVAYGRSGSTLVQGLLNTVPDYLIRGENRGVLYRLYQYHSGLEKARDEFGRSRALTPRDSWYGIDGYSAASAVTRIRSLLLDTLLKPQPDTRVVGFKEIRWFYRDWEPYLAFVQEVFPGARFVVNTRDHQGVAGSQWWSKHDRAEVINRITGYEKQMTAMVAKLGAAAYRIHYDDYVADPSMLGGLFGWLGEPFDAEAVARTMAVRHSF